MLSFEAAKSVEGAAFTLHAGQGPRLPLVLERVEASSGGGVPGAARQPFSLVFKGTRNVLCPQGTYILENAELGALEMFLVPIAEEPETGDFSYQAVFG